MMAVLMNGSHQGPGTPWAPLHKAQAVGLHSSAWLGVTSEWVHALSACPLAYLGGQCIHLPPY